MKEIILLKNGEIALKGLNRSVFEDRLINNARRRLEPLGRFSFRKAQSTIYVEPKTDGVDLDEAADRLQKVYGIAALTRACVVEKDFEDIKAKAAEYLREELEDAKTFKVEAKRSDKSFPMNSPEICRELGAHLLEHFPHLAVDVHNPDVTVVVEVRDFAAYVHGSQLPGAGGIPVGSGGRALLLLSGGIDSPVAGAMMAKRGLEVFAIHFASPPYTSERAKQKVITLAEKMTAYCGRINLFVVPFTEIQEAIKDQCPEDLFTIIMRRYMMRIAERIAEKTGSLGLITGESIGQVASQTMQSLAATDDACSMPVFRPVIGFDKQEIVDVAERIGTFETSIQPFEDCCTIFVAKHPVTKPRLNFIEKAEHRLTELDRLLDEAVKNAEVIEL